MPIQIEGKRVTVHGYDVIGFESEGCYIISAHLGQKRYSGEERVWLMPKDISLPSFLILCTKYSVKNTRKASILDFENDNYQIKEYSGRPFCDFFGKQFIVELENCQDFNKAYARFYWDNLIPQIAERSFMAKKKGWRDGYVLSTLNHKAYGGTYPAVDHEFHIKGRLAVAGKAEISLVKRMLEAQIRIMKEDKLGLSRNVCSVQPNGKREYDIWRFSKDKTVKAQMFRITANIEFIEALYNYYCLTKDIDFIKENKKALEDNCAYIESFIDKNTKLLNSHVYYEDQVIKDGCVSQAQCFAIYNMHQAAKLEILLSDSAKAEHYQAVAKTLKDSFLKPFPNGFWDEKNKRFIDWIDSKGNAHDRVHLLANRLPELFELVDQEKARHSQNAIDAYDDVFKKFPSFVGGKIEEYTDSEIGTGGPYDLCAAGRYWCWDASYLAFKGEGQKLLAQLKKVYEEADANDFFMGERYDMNYVYYNKGKDADRIWHGASLYYEYPNVFLKVLINDYLGLKFGFDTDIEISSLFANGRVFAENYGVEIVIDKGIMTIRNLTDKALSVRVAKSEVIRIEAYSEAIKRLGTRG